VLARADQFGADRERQAQALDRGSVQSAGKPDQRLEPTIGVSDVQSGIHGATMTLNKVNTVSNTWLVIKFKPLGEHRSGFYKTAQ
jgi:hypothetical protein